MDTRTYFNFPDPEPEPEFETYEAWAWRLVSEERRAIESLVRESVSTRAAPSGPAIPPMPDVMPVNESIRAAWSIFHSALRPPRIRRESARTTRRPGVRELHTLVADPDVRHLLP